MCKYDKIRKKRKNFFQKCHIFRCWIVTSIEGGKKDTFNSHRKGEQKMKRNMKRRILMSLLLVAAMTIIPVSNSQAKVNVLEKIEDGAVVQIGGGDTVDPQYVNAATINASIAISGSTACVYAKVSAKKVCHISVVMRLQRKEGNTWTTKRSWVAGSDTGYKVMSEDAALSQRGQYRTYAVFNVAGEEITYASTPKTY